MQVTSVKKGRARGRQRTRPGKEGRQPVRKEAAAKTKAKSGHTHTHERQLALGLRWEGGPWLWWVLSAWRRRALVRGKINWNFKMYEINFWRLASSCFSAFSSYVALSITWLFIFHAHLPLASCHLPHMQRMCVPCCWHLPTLCQVFSMLSAPLLPLRAFPCCLGHLSNTLHDVICSGGAAVYKRFDLQLLLHSPSLCVCFAKFTYRLAEGLHNEGHSLLHCCTLANG